VVKALGQRVLDPDCALQALASLAKLGPRAKAALPKLRESLKDSSAQINVAEAISKIDPQADEPLAILVRTVRDEKTRWYALRAARRIGLANKEMLDVLPAALDDMNIFVYREASDYLTEISAKNDAALPVLVAAADHRQAWVREKALAALGRLGPKAKAGVPVMVKALSHRSRQTRLEAARALAQLGPAAKDATPILKDLLHTHDPLVLPFVAEALAKIDGPSDEIVQALIKAFHTSSFNHTETRQKAAEVLADIGPKARAALPVLLDAAHDTGSYNTGHLDVRPHAAWAVWKIDGQTDTAVYSLTHSLKVCRGPARAKAAEALAAIGPEAKGALPTLRRVLKDYASAGRPESEVRDAIAAAIRKLE
jgi:HEAT repeat protein